MPPSRSASATLSHRQVDEVLLLVQVGEDADVAGNVGCISSSAGMIACVTERVSPLGCFWIVITTACPPTNVPDSSRANALLSPRFTWPASTTRATCERNHRLTLAVTDDVLQVLERPHSADARTRYSFGPCSSR